MIEQPPAVDVFMLQRDLANAPRFDLPNGYQLRFYRPGDLDTWLRIQATDRHYIPTAETFVSSLPGDDNYLAQRVLFLADATGHEIGTITAWNNRTVADHEIGHIHWVAIVPEAQGRGLGKPMLSAACAILREQRYDEACLETNTVRIPAINLYLRFGFRPVPRSEAETAAWQAIAPMLRYQLHF